MDMTKYAESEYLTSDKVKAATNKIGVIISDVSEVKGDYGLKPQVTVDFNDMQKKWSMNRQSVANLCDNVSKDSLKWIGKQILFTTSKASNGKTTIVGMPVSLESKEQEDIKKLVEMAKEEQEKLKNEVVKEK